MAGSFRPEEVNARFGQPHRDSMLPDPNRILIVDDEPEVHEHITRVFRRAHVRDQITSVSSGEDAVAILKQASADMEQAPTPFLVLLDLRMPGMTGFDVLSWLQEHEQFDRVIVVVLSAGLTQDRCEIAFQRGAFSCIEKFPAADELIALYDVAKARALRERKMAELRA